MITRYVIPAGFAVSLMTDRSGFYSVKRVGLQIQGYFGLMPAGDGATRQYWPVYVGGKYIEMATSKALALAAIVKLLEDEYQGKGTCMSSRNTESGAVSST